MVAARDVGIPVFAEACPHYLFFDDSEYESADFDAARFVMSLPFHAREMQKELWRALKLDDLQLIATDHRPFCMK